MQDHSAHKIECRIVWASLRRASGVSDSIGNADSELPAGHFSPSLRDLGSVIWRRLSFFLFFLFLCPSFLQALEIPKRPDGYVSDYAGMISNSARQELEAKLAQFERETSNQLIVATFPSLEGESLEDFSIRLAEAWKPGQKAKNNGVILLIFRNDRKVRIEVGYGLEGVLTDATAKLIIENEITPAFRQENFDGGVQKAVQSIFLVIRGEYKPEGKTEGPEHGFLPAALLLALFSLLNRRFSFLAGQAVCLLLAIFLPSVVFGFFSIVIGVLALMSAAGRRGYYMGSTRSGSWSSGSWSGGGFGGGGFSGGGGSFGGGGASGGW